MIELPFQQKVLKSFLNKPQNSKCADCNSKSPTWASIDFGIFVCLNCSGAHRRLSTRYTRVKSTTLDTWCTQWAEFMVLNNQLINRYWQENLNGRKKPNQTSSQQQINRFVQEKYLKKKFANPQKIDPIAQLKQQKNRKQISGTEKAQIKSSTKSNIQVELLEQTQQANDLYSTKKTKPQTLQQKQEIDLLDFNQPTIKKVHSISTPHQTSLDHLKNNFASLNNMNNHKQNHSMNHYMPQNYMANVQGMYVNYPHANFNIYPNVQQNQNSLIYNNMNVQSQPHENRFFGLNNHQHSQINNNFVYSNQQQNLDFRQQNNMNNISYNVDYNNNKNMNNLFNIQKQVKVDNKKTMYEGFDQFKFA